MRAIILVGGEGTRLRPLTYDTPKQLLPLVGVPMLECVFALLARHGVDEVVLSLGYLPNRFIEAYPEGSINGVTIRYAVEPEPLDTAGAIRFAATTAGVSDTFIVMNGDVLTNLDLTALLTFHRERGALATIALHEVDDPSRYGVVPTDASGRVIDFVEKPPKDEAPTNNINAGTYVLEPSVIDHIDGGRRVSIERETFPLLAQEGRLFAMPSDAYWIDTGTPASFVQANVDVLGGVDVGRPIEVDDRGVWRAPSAQVAPSATLHNVVVDEGCVVAANAVLADVVLMPGARVDEGAQLHGCLVGSRATIGQRAHLGPTCVVDVDYEVPESTVVDGDVKFSHR